MKEVVECCLVDVAILIVTCCAAFIFYCRLKKRSRQKYSARQLVAFFHPYCNDGGGGERVLWCSVKAIQQLKQDIDVIIITGFNSTEANTVNTTLANTIIEKVNTRFGIQLPRPVKFIFLKRRWLVEASTWPRFTLLGQSFGSMLLALETLQRTCPDVLIDSMGYAFTYPLFSYFGGCKVACYVHYPTISTDMLSAVSLGRATYNNAASISQSSLKTKFKIWYYKLFAFLYGLAGPYSQLIMANSSWTLGHINSLWKVSQRTYRVYPPCNTEEFTKFELKNRKQVIISIAQFRPEKDHNLQVDSMHTFLQSHPEWREKVKLVMIGSCRNREDEERINNLKKRVSELHLQGDIEFAVNVDFGTLKKYLAESLIGLHTMWNEHFGIGVVEMMASGLITVAHNSGGPREDIVVDYNGRTGYLASTPQEYAEQFYKILNLSEASRLEIQQAARRSTERFSDDVYRTQFQTLISRVL